MLPTIVGSMRLMVFSFEAAIAATARMMAMSATKIATDVMATSAAKILVHLARISHNK